MSKLNQSRGVDGNFRAAVPRGNTQTGYSESMGKVSGASNRKLGDSFGGNSFESQRIQTPGSHMVRGESGTGRNEPRPGVSYSEYTAMEAQRIHRSKARELNQGDASHNKPKCGREDRM
jgi:hypothetical protein